VPPIFDSEESKKLRAKFEEQASRILYLLGVAMKLEVRRSNSVSSFK